MGHEREGFGVGCQKHGRDGRCGRWAGARSVPEPAEEGGADDVLGPRVRRGPHSRGGWTRRCCVCATMAPRHEPRAQATGGSYGAGGGPRMCDPSHASQEFRRYQGETSTERIAGLYKVGVLCAPPPAHGFVCANSMTNPGDCGTRVAFKRRAARAPLPRVQVHPVMREGP